MVVAGTGLRTGQGITAAVVGNQPIYAPVPSRNSIESPKKCFLS